MTSLTTNSWILGVNLSGAEFGNPYTGRMFWDYIYPTTSELDHYASEGAKVVRIPISLERLQPTSNGVLDAAQLSTLDSLIQDATADRLKVVLDPHNYGYAFGAEIGSTPASNIAFADFWSKLAAHYASNSQIIFGLMNEPHVQSATEWLGSANMAIAAIRSAGATTQEILVPGTAWDTAATWLQSGNAAAFAYGVVDPLNNYAIEVHQYFDSDNSGTHSSVVSATIGAERLKAVTEWAESTGHALFLGEFGAASDSLSLQALSNTLTYMQAHADVWQGGTYWASGPWMSSYMFSPETASGSDTPQMTTLEQFMTLPGSTNPAPSASLSISPHMLSSLTGTNDLIQVYRFFDSRSGSQFLTADPQETNTLVATRQDLFYEGNGLTALVTLAGDPFAITVSRFYDTNNGTHFYTANNSEKAEILNSRPDLVLEQASFYEHSVKQATDLPVYRFFESKIGTHFYTTAESERANIIASRPDMVYEGVAFYSPQSH